jgi:hypothetical protein
MAAIGIEVVDAAVIAVREGERLAASPGIALLAPAGPLVGAAAAAAARLQPMLAADRFWSDLSQDAFVDGGGGRPRSRHARASRRVRSCCTSTCSFTRRC